MVGGGAARDGLGESGLCGVLRGEALCGEAGEGEEAEVKDAVSTNACQQDLLLIVKVGCLRDDTGNRVASDLHLFQGIDMRHAYPWHLVPVRQCLCALIASVADRNYILEYRLPQFES